MANIQENLIEAIKKLAEAITKDRAATNQHGADLVLLPDTNAYIFEAETSTLRPVTRVAAPQLSLLMGIDRTKQTLLENSLRFAAGYSANNALLWGARGMGKSTLVKTIHNHLTVELKNEAPTLIEIHREDIAALPSLLNSLRNQSRQFVIYCDDLSFNQPDRDFKALKSVLEGGLEGRPDNVIFYATSNRRHLVPRTITEHEGSVGLHSSEAMDETVALSDRFGLWLGFHAASQADFLAMIEAYMKHFELSPNVGWHKEALEWSKTRGNRSGRTAWQYVTNIAGSQNRKIHF